MRVENFMQEIIATASAIKIGSTNIQNFVRKEFQISHPLTVTFHLKNV